MVEKLYQVCACMCIPLSLIITLTSTECFLKCSLEFEIPPNTQKGEISTIEGFLMTAAKNLGLFQEERLVDNPEVGEKVRIRNARNACLLWAPTDWPTDLNVHEQLVALLCANSLRIIICIVWLCDV